MKPLLLSLVPALLLCAPSAFANDNSQYAYHHGVLLGSHRDDSARDCIAGSDTSGSMSLNGASSCADQYNIVYTVTADGATYILTPRGDNDESKCGLLMRATIPHSVLDKQPPQTPIKLRSDGKHFFVKIGDRESEYSVARVE